MLNRQRMSLGGTLSGYPLMHTLEEFEPVVLEKEMEMAQGGRFVPEQMMVGLKEMTARVTLSGGGIEIVAALGITEGDTVELDVIEALKDLEGNRYQVWHRVSGEITKVERNTVKMKDKPQLTYTIAPVATSCRENGVILHDIDLRRQVINLGQGDIMEPYRRMVLSP